MKYTKDKRQIDWCCLVVDFLPSSVQVLIPAFVAWFCISLWFLFLSFWSLTFLPFLFFVLPPLNGDIPQGTHRPTKKRRLVSVSHIVALGVGDSLRQVHLLRSVVI